MPTQVLYRIALFAEHHYRALFVAALALVLASGLLALRIRFDTDVLNMLPQDDPVVSTFREALAEFGGLNLLLVAIRIPEGAVLDPYTELADRLGPALEDLEEIEYVDYRLGDLTELVRTFLPQAAFFLDADGRRAVGERLRDGGISRRVEEVRRQLSLPQALARKELLLLDPMGISELLIDRLGQGRGSLGVDWTSGYFLSRDRRLLLLLAKPIEPAQDVIFTRRLVAQVEGVLEGILQDWRSDAVAASDSRPVAVSPPEVVLGGGYLTALDDTELIQRDVIVNVLSSMAGVLLLFLFAFRRLGLLLYAFVPLSCGLIFTFGFAGASTPVLSSATSGFAALLIGLGIDFVIVSYGRYVEERDRGVDTSTALRRMTGSCGRAVVIGGVTSAATFYAFMVTEFEGLRQMGFLTGTGILFCMLAVLFLLPALLAWSEARHQRRRSAPTLFTHGLGTGHLVRFCFRQPRLILAIGFALTVVAGFLVLQLGFEDGIRNMRADGNRGVAVEKEVSEHFGSNFEYMMLVLEGSSLEDVLEQTADAVQRFRQHVDGSTLTGVEAITDLVPPPGAQRLVLDWLAAERADGLAPNRLRSTFRAALASEGLRPEPFADGFDLLLSAFASERPITVDDLTSHPTTSRVVERYLRATDDGWKSVLYLYTPPQVWKRQPPPEVESVAAELGSGAVLTGVNVVSRNLRQQVWRDAIVAAFVGLVLVAILLWLDFRELGVTLLSLVPLLIGIFWMLGGMVVLGISMNFMNVFVTTMVIGIGVDYGIHMLHRYRELRSANADRRSMEEGLAKTGQAIVMAAATTMVGFGSMSLSHYRGLKSIGYLAILGAFFTAIVATTILPAYLSLKSRAER